MENHTNGKAHSKSNGTAVEPGSNIERAFMLASEVIQLETKLSKSLHELTELVHTVDPEELPKFLLAMMRQPGIADSVLSTMPIPHVLQLPESTKKDDNFYPEEGWKGKVIVLMQDGRERKSEKIIKQLRATKYKSSVYQALKELAQSGALIKTAYAHYQIQSKQ